MNLNKKKLSEDDIDSQLSSLRLRLKKLNKEIKKDVEVVNNKLFFDKDFTKTKDTSLVLKNDKSVLAFDFVNSFYEIYFMSNTVNDFELGIYNFYKMQIEGIIVALNQEMAIYENKLNNLELKYKNLEVQNNKLNSIVDNNIVKIRALNEKIGILEAKNNALLDEIINIENIRFREAKSKKIFEGRIFKEKN